MSQERKLKVMVLAGGPDRERPVSLLSGRAVAAGLEASGHEVRLCDVAPEDLSCFDEFSAWAGDVVFPVLHGPWGEGGPLQRILDDRGVRYVGCREAAARLCMDKNETKRVLEANDLATPAFEVIGEGDSPTLRPPVVVKALREGSSIGMAICHDKRALEAAVMRLQPVHGPLLVERFIEGLELTVGVIDRSAGQGERPEPWALTPILIETATDFYDYQAKYERDDTRYVFDPTEMGVAPCRLEEVRRVATQAHRVLGCRHLSRVDFMLDRVGRAYVLEVNTMPGFTAHSLLPKAAARAGMELAALTDHLVRLVAHAAGITR